jgi:hypothetical protein
MLGGAKEPAISTSRGGPAISIWIKLVLVHVYASQLRPDPQLTPALIIGFSCSSSASQQLLKLGLLRMRAINRPLNSSNAVINCSWPALRSLLSLIYSWPLLVLHMCIDLTTVRPWIRGAYLLFMLIDRSCNLRLLRPAGGQSRVSPSISFVSMYK